MKKKIMFILCTIVILCVGSIVNAATSLKDVVNTKYEDSVNTLITLGIVNGYPEDNTYRPNNVVTRAEMAKLMVVALGEEENVASAKKETAKFKDVKSSDWEYGYVNLAAKLGIINGYPDGTFGSKNTVSYAEATAMIVRALEYEDEVSKSKDVWPTNYMNQAKKLSLYEDVGTVTANDGAKRGNIAILLWNMLRTGVCTVVGQNDGGLVYGEGTKLINKTLTKFTYFEDVLINSVEFDDSYEEAIVKIAGDKTVKVTMDALDASEMYGRRFNILYNTTNKKIEDIEASEKASIKEGEITKIKSGKIYIDGGSSNGYTLPKDANILLYGVDYLDEAVTATLIFDGSTLKYVVGYSPEEVFLALVTATEVTVSNKDGIKVMNYKASSAKSYALEDKDKMPDLNDIILYYLNKDNKLVILDASDVFTSTEVDTANTTKIVAGKNTYKLADTAYDIAKVKTSSLTSMSVSSIEEDVDSIDVMKYAGRRYFIVYVGGVDKAYEQLEKDIDSACSTLSSYRNKSAVKTAYSNESKYTLATYTKFSNAYDDAGTAITDAQNKATVANLNKVKTLYTDLQSAYTGLKLISSLSTTADRNDETSLVNAKIALRKLVNGTTTYEGKKVTTCVANKDTYSTSTYATFNTALTNAKSLLRSTTATQNKIENAETALKNAMKGLITKTEDSGRVEALKALEAKIAEAESMKTNSAAYVEAAYNIFLEYLANAKAVKTSTTSTEDEIKAATDDLNDAIVMLSGSLKESSLNNLLQRANEKLEQKEIYITSTVKALEDAVKLGEEAKEGNDYTKLAQAAKAIEDAIDGLIKIDDRLKELLAESATYRATSIKEIVGNMTKDNLGNYTYAEKEMKITELAAEIVREQAMINSWRSALTAQIDFANTIKTENDWNTVVYAGEYSAFVTARTNAITVKDTANATSVELKAAHDNLVNAMRTK